MENDLAYELESEGEHLVVKVSGKLDAQSAPALEEAMSGALGGITDTTFDLEGLDYISSAGLRVLLATHKLMAKREGTMTVENVGEEVMTVFKMSGFSAIFAIA